jgi:hypothetical protein
MTYQGVVQNGVVVFGPGVALDEGTIVSVTPVSPAKSPNPEIPEDDPLYRIFELAGPGGIPDLSTNIDHYLYGHPKVREFDCETGRVPSGGKKP